MLFSKPNQPIRRDTTLGNHWRDGNSQEGLIIEAWGQGFFLGALLIMGCITIAALKKKVLLHKLILIEQLLAMPHGTFCFMAFKGYGYYVSLTATLLFCSYVLHNVVAWLKVKPFFIGKSPCFFNQKTGQITQVVYCLSLALTIPVWIFNTYNNFEWNNYTSELYPHVRPYEFLVRDPWWVFTNVVLLHVIGKTYGISIVRLVRISPRLGILLLAIFLAIAFTIVDVVATILESKFGEVDGINPFWKLSLVFKCLTDAIMLDDFATELKRISDDQRLQKHIPQSSLPLQINTNEDYAKRGNPDPASQAVETGMPYNHISGRHGAEMDKKAHSLADSDAYLEIEDVGRLAS